MKDLFGFLNVNKPPGMTSRDVVNRVQRLVRPAKIGHAGTLDPLATGVLVICLGPATRLTEYVQRAPKAYAGKFLLGRRSDTEDVEGEVELLADAAVPSHEELREAVAGFRGRIEQLPPRFSALKVKGKRAHDLARKGVDFELQPRPVTIHACELTSFDYPEFALSVECSSGTYIRSLGRDIGLAVGSAAVMCELVRTAVGGFRLEDAVQLDDLNGGNLRERLSAPELAVSELPQVVVSPQEQQRLAAGMPIQRRPAAEQDVASEWAALDEEGRLLAILRGLPDGTLKPSKNLRRAKG